MTQIHLCEYIIIKRYSRQSLKKSDGWFLTMHMLEKISNIFMKFPSYCMLRYTAISLCKNVIFPFFVSFYVSISILILFTTFVTICVKNICYGFREATRLNWW